MKAKLALIVALVAVLALAGVGCDTGAKVTGGGWFNDSMNGVYDSATDTWSGNRVNFGFNAQVDKNGEVKGQFQLIDHDANINLHGTFDHMDILGLWGGVCVVKGIGSVNGEDVPFELSCIDAGEPGPSAGDMVAVWVYADSPLFYSGYLEGGNVQVHKAK